MPSEAQENTGERSYVAFISYRHKELDREAAVRIQKKIENYVVPKEYRDKVGGKKLGVCFRDEDELPASSSLSDSITYALDHTQFLIVICTPDLPLSKWCMQEITYFLRTHDRDHVLAVLVDGDPEESFPEPLRFSYDDEGRLLAEVEPLAANIAGENHTINNKTFKKEVVRLFAAIIGCPFDALWQRERRARTNRLIAAAGVVFAAMAIFLGVVLNKNAQISEQNSQILEQNDQIRQQLDQISEQKDQISEQNDQISEQNTQLQQQMSSVRVDSGKMQLEAFDKKTAMVYALNALESNDPAIYDHRAEKLLADALDTYTVQYTQCSLLCEQTTKITQLAAMEDGRTLLTADAFGTVRAFDTDTGVTRWEVPLGTTKTMRLYPVNEKGLVICKTYDSCVALSVDSGQTVWDFVYKDASGMEVLSEDESIFVVMDRGIEVAGERIPTLIFLDTVNGRSLQKIPIPCDGFQVRSTFTFDYYYQYAGDFSADKTLFACAVPVVNEDEEQTKGMIFFAADLTDGSIRRIGSFTQEPDMILSLVYYDQEESVYTAVSLSHHLYSAVFPLDKSKEIISLDYDYSLSSRSGFASYDYMFQELPYLPPLNNSGMSIVFSRNVIYLMNLNNGAMRNTINLDSAIVHAEWIDPEEEIFQVLTESGWCLQYNVSHYENKAIESLNGRSMPVKGIQKAAFIRGGSYTNMEDGITVITREDAPGQLLLSKTVSDVSLAELPARANDASFTYVTLAPSGERLMAFSRNEDNNTVLEVYDFTSGTWSSALELPFYIYSDSYQTSLLIPDDEHIIYGGMIYSLDGSTEELNTEFPEHITYQDPSAYLLSDGTLLCTCESKADYGGYRLSKVSVLSCRLDGVLLEDCETIQDGLALQYDEYHPHLYAAGKNGWISAWGNAAYFDEKNVQQFTEDPVLTVKNLRTGEKYVVENALSGVTVSQMIFSHSRPLLMVLYETGQVQVFDLADRGRVLMETVYAYGEIKSAAFSDQDNWMLILTAMNWLDCYDMSTGEHVFAEADAFVKSDSDVFGSIYAKEDPANKKLIVKADFSYSTTGTAVILDMDAWVRTEAAGNYLAISLEENAVIIGDTDSLYTCPYYTIDDLAAQAREILK